MFDFILVLIGIGAVLGIGYALYDSMTFDPPGVDSGRAPVSGRGGSSPPDDDLLIDRDYPDHSTGFMDDPLSDHHVHLNPATGSVMVSDSLIDINGHAFGTSD